MTDPDASAADAAAERLARVAARRAPKGPPVEGARILTAGISGSLLLGLMAWMGWSDHVATSAVAPTVTAPAATTPTATPAYPTASQAGPTAAPAATVPVPIEIPVAAAAPAPVAPAPVVPVATTRPSD